MVYSCVLRDDRPTYGDPVNDVVLTSHFGTPAEAIAAFNTIIHLHSLGLNQGDHSWWKVTVESTTSDGNCVDLVSHSF